MCINRNKINRNRANTISQHLLRVMVRWERRVVTLLNLLAERDEVHLVSVKWALQRCHL